MSDPNFPPPAGEQPYGADPKAATAAAQAYAKAQRKWYQKKRWWAAIVIAVLVVASVATGGSKSDKHQADSPVASADSTSSSKPSGSAEPESPKVPSFKNGVLTTEDVRIVITRHKIIQPGQKGNEYGSKPVIAFWYKVTNLSGKKTNPTTDWAVEFDAYQDNDPNADNKLETGSLPDDRFLNTQLENIKKGGTVENAWSYELDDLKTPVQLVAAGFGDEIGRMTYPIK